MRGRLVRLIQPSIAINGHDCERCKRLIAPESPIFKVAVPQGEDYWCERCARFRFPEQVTS